jgi:hypothetical protein
MGVLERRVHAAEHRDDLPRRSTAPIDATTADSTSVAGSACRRARRRATGCEPRVVHAPSMDVPDAPAATQVLETMTLPFGTTAADRSGMTTTKRLSTLMMLAVSGCAFEPSTPVEPDQALDAAALELAQLLTDEQLRSGLQTMIAEKHDGDFNVLFSTARHLRLADGRTLGDALEATGVAAAVPRLQIASPLGLEGWSASNLPDVTSAPDEVTGDFTYHDVAGNQWTARADVVPARPVLVLGSNERVGATAGLEPAPAPPDGSQLVGEKTRYLRMINIYDDKEPWYRGDPEIYIYCRPAVGTEGHVSYVDLARVNSENHQYWWDAGSEPKLIDVAAGSPEVCEILERDGSDMVPPLDDFIANVTFRYEDASYLDYDLGDARIKVRW